MVKKDDRLVMPPLSSLVYTDQSKFRNMFLNNRFSPKEEMELVREILPTIISKLRDDASN